MSTFSEIALFLLIVAFGTLAFKELWHRPKKRSVGKVIKLQYFQGYLSPFPSYSTDMDLAVVPIRNYCPDSWNVTFEVDDFEGFKEIDRETFALLSEGNPVEVEYYIGRLTGFHYIKKIERSYA